MLDAEDLFDVDDGGLQQARLTSRSLAESQGLMGSVLEALPVAVMIHTEQGIIFANREAAELLQSRSSALLGQHFLDFVQSEDIPAMAKAMRSAIQGGSPELRECLIARADGSRRLVEVSCARLPWKGNAVAQVIFRDVTDQKRAEASLRRLAITDELTGAYNRRHFFYEGALYVDRCRGSGEQLSIVMVDIDHFKKVNDTFGHQVGDVALQHLTNLGNMALLSLRESDSAIFARYGGEEFVLLLPGLALPAAARFAEELRRTVADTPVVAETLTFRITVSLGVASYLPGDGALEHLVHRADAALYRAKADGRNRVIAD